ncbi:MAG: zinc ribbon domain-containing protein [Thermoplasmata archaeon]|nr:zinc ribbon domain-containing protein [Thermoplasmata archaeon]
MSGRVLFFIIPVMIISLSMINNVGSASDDPIAYGPHWVPSKPLTGEEFDFFIYVTVPFPSEVKEITLNINGKEHLLGKFSNTDNEYHNGTIYYSSLTIDIEGIFFYNVTLDLNDTIIYIQRGEIEIMERESDNDKDTILGLPRWWCVISVIFGTIFLIFLTWAYFKGRSIKQSQLTQLHSRMSCSSCSAKIGQQDTECSKCGSILDDLEYICGNCGGDVDHLSKKCIHCGSRLEESGNQISDEYDRDLIKLKERIDMKGKATCPYCNGIISPTDKICPACKKKL